MTLRILPSILAAILIAVFVFPGCAQAQILGIGGGAPAAAPAEKDPFGRDTPRGLMFGYLQAVSSGNYEQAGQYLAMPSSSESFRLARSTRLARDLETLLDRAGSLNDNWTISSSPDGHLSDGQKEGIDVLGKIVINGTATPLLAERTILPNGRVAWKISRQTVEAIPPLLAATSHGIADRIMPSRSMELEIFSVPVGHLLLSAGVVIGLWGFVYLVAAGVLRLARHIATRRGLEASLAFLTAMREPLVTIATAGLVLPGLEAAGVSVILRGYLSPVLDIVVWVSLARIAMRVVDIIAESAVERAQARGMIGSISFFHLLRRAGKLFVVFFAILLILSAIGVDLTAGLAALGIGGIAIALGSQKTIEHFVGSLTVVADRVVRIGDFCRFGTILGTVEDIGIRSTRIRTLSRTLVTVPNGIFSSTEIENYTSRDKFLFKHIITLQPGTSRSQIAICLEEIRQILADEPQVDPDPARVRLISVNLAVPNIEVFAYVYAADWDEFLMHQENLILRILAAIERAGTSLSAPVQDVRLGRATALATASLSGEQPAAVQLPLFDRDF